MIMENKWYKELWRGLSGLMVFMLSVMAAVGGVGYLISDGHYIFALAVALVCVFAYKPIKEYLLKKLFK